MPYVSYTLRCESSAMDGSFRRWIMDNNDTPATIDSSGYITDASAKGMAVGDLVTYRQWTNAPTAATTNRPNPGVTPSAYGALVAVGDFVVDAINANGSGDLRDTRAYTATDTD